MNIDNIKSRRTHVITALVICFMSGGCATTHKMRKVKTSGFLKDYSILKPVEGADRAQLLYVKPGFNMLGYENLLLDPITIWAAEKSKLSKQEPKALSGLANYLDASTRKELSQVFTLTDKAAPGTLRMRLAITEAQASRPMLDLTSTVLPYGLALSSARKIFLGKHGSVGEARIEMELLDSETGELLAAAVDARAGTKAFQGKFDRWDDVESAYGTWAKRMRVRFAEGRETK